MVLKYIGFSFVSSECSFFDLELKVAALTNNFNGDDAAEPLWHMLKANFDV